MSKKQIPQKSNLTFFFHNFYWLSKNSNLFISVRHFWTYNNLILQRQYDFKCRHGFDYGFYSSKDLTINRLNPFRPNPGRREKIKLNFYFLTSLWCLKINLIFISVQLSQIHGTLRVNDYLFKISQSNIKTMLGRDINKSIL